jgi:RNA ligase (TIGR02306 family)
MAFFGVTIETIEKVEAHPNADRLDVCKLEGVDFQFVTGKGLRNVGDKVLYFPLDALLPLDVADAMELGGKLAGKDKNRVKSIKLRGLISQGVIGDLDMLDTMEDEKTTENITKHLGVEKWEPEPIMSSSGNLLPLPDGCSKYDIEGCERYGQVLAELMNEPVCITEKMEGTNFSVLIKEDGSIFVNQRGFTIERIEGKENTYWKAAEENGIIGFAQWMGSSHSGTRVAVYGELCGPGIQNNIYKLKEHTVFVFDIKLNGQWMDKGLMLFEIEEYNNNSCSSIKTVPVLETSVPLIEFLDGKTIKDASNGKSVLGPKLREGIVINPVDERHSYALSGRLILKQRSPEYLAKTDN